MAHVQLSGAMIANEFMRLLVDDPVLRGRPEKRHYVEGFAQASAVKGNTVYLWVPPDFEANPRGGLRIEGFTESYLRVLLKYQPHVELEFGTADLLLSMERFGQCFLIDKAAVLAATINNLWEEGAELVTADLPLPLAFDMSVRTVNRQSGLSLRLVRDYDVFRDLFVARVEVLCGFTEVKPDWAFIFPTDRERITQLLSAKAQLEQRIGKLKRA